MEKTRIEIWDNTEQNKCVHSFELWKDDTQKISIRKNNNPRSSVFIDIESDKIKIITESETEVFHI